MLKEYLCPLNTAHGNLKVSPHTPGAYRCPVCNSLFDRELDLERKQNFSFLTHDIQRKFYEQLLSTHETHIPLGGGRNNIIRQFTQDHSECLIILGAKYITSQFKMKNVISYYEFNRTNINLYKEILIDHSSFGQKSFQREALLESLLKQKNKDLIFIIK